MSKIISAMGDNCIPGKCISEAVWSREHGNTSDLPDSAYTLCRHCGKMLCGCGNGPFDEPHHCVGDDDRDDDDYRDDDIQPLKARVRRTKQRRWEQFRRDGAALEIAKNVGKYLFFAREREHLVNIALNELKHHGFARAKINIGMPVGGEYVLCLYYKDASRRNELRDRMKKEYPEVRGVFWKTDSDTLSGKYSEKFKKDISKGGFKHPLIRDLFEEREIYGGEPLLSRRNERG